MVSPTCLPCHLPGPAYPCAPLLRIDALFRCAFCRHLYVAMLFAGLPGRANTLATGWRFGRCALAMQRFALRIAVPSACYLPPFCALTSGMRWRLGWRYARRLPLQTPHAGRRAAYCVGGGFLVPRAGTDVRCAAARCVAAAHGCRGCSVRFHSCRLPFVTTSINIGLSGGSGSAPYPFLLFYRGAFQHSRQWMLFCCLLPTGSGFPPGLWV